MRKIFFALSVCAAVVSLSGCSSSSSDPAQRAAELIKAKGVDIPHFSTMDSVMGYPDAFACEMTAADTQWRADSLLRAYTKDGSVAQHRDDLLTMGDVVFSLKKGAAKTELEAGLKKTPKEFVGYQVFIADSLSDDMVRVMMNKEMSKIAIEKIKVR